MDFPAVGDIFHGHYQLDSVLGRGGFATVFAARDARTGDTVALKVLRPEGEKSYARDTRARFEREVRVLGDLEHPHIIDELEFGQSDDGFLFVAFELLPGRDLADVLEELGRLSPVLVTSVLRQILSALEAAHGVGLLHRDLKPQNIRVIEERPDHLHVKLLDFGIARSTDDGHPAITKTGELIGTPRYMSPEQLRGVSLGPASDIYSLGLLVFELLMGRKALAGNTIFEQIERMASGHLMSVPELERANPALLAIIQRMTQRDPTQRFQSAREVLNALDSLGESGGYAGAAPPSITQLAFDPTFESRDSVEHPPLEPQPASAVEPSSSRKLRYSLAVLAVALAVVGLVVSSATRGPEVAVEAKPVSRQVPSSNAEAVRAQPDAQAESERDAGRLRLGDASPDEVGRVVDPSPGCNSSAPFMDLGKIDDVLPAYVPRGYSPQRAHAAVLLIHDLDRRPSELMIHTGFIELADEHHIVLLAPRGKPGDWGEPDDIRAEVRESLDLAERRLCIDRGRVFVVSHGRGGRASAPLSCASWVTAVAQNSYGFRYDDDDVNSRDVRRLFCPDVPKPMLMVSPTKSAAVPIGGERGCADLRRYFSISEHRELWKGRNGCSGQPRNTVDLPGGTCQTWTCDQPFTSCLVGGGYPWPGTTIQRGHLRCVMEEEAPDFPTARVMWEFFDSVEPLEANDSSAD